MDDSDVTYRFGFVQSLERHSYRVLQYAYSGGSDAAELLEYLVGRFGPVSSFSGSYRADAWTLNIQQRHYTGWCSLKLCKPKIWMMIVLFDMHSICTVISCGGGFHTHTYTHTHIHTMADCSQIAPSITAVPDHSLVDGPQANSNSFTTTHTIVSTLFASVLLLILLLGIIILTVACFLRVRTVDREKTAYDEFDDPRSYIGESSFTPKTVGSDVNPPIIASQ